ncbi:MAG: BMP family ABC transporter substrate-binding protein, partial [Chloroflexota bacterium]|nr:BMP family ABC transporter substrate-binding protein [Chloroflexota bacterium]
MKRFLAFFVLASLVVTACGGAGIPGIGGGGPKVGMVTDIGQLEDKSFNEFSWKGVQDGAKAVGGEAKVIVTKDQ